jgi:dethiobiotin synthetase
VLNEGIRLPHPVSPHLAAKLNGSSIDLAPLISLAASLSGGGWIVEGAGGVLVPLNERDLLIDLICGVKLPVLIVSRSVLGTINHTLLTIEALARRAVPIAGVVMVGPPGDLARENRLAIERYGRVAVVGEMPMLNPLTPERLRGWAESSFDRAGHLTDFLT